MTKNQVRKERPVKISDPIRVAVRFHSPQHGGIVGAGGTIIPRMALESVGRIFDHGTKDKSRVLIAWRDYGDCGIWLDADQLEPVSSGRDADAQGVA